MKNKVFYLIIFGFIGLLSIVLILQNYQLRKELLYSQKILKFISNSNININHLNRILAKYIFSNLSNGDFKWNLVIIFSPEDCPYCLKEISFWAHFKEKHKNFGCWGLVNHPHVELVSKFIKSMGWNFPIYVIKENLFGDNFGLGKTPIKVLLNDRNQIYYIEGPIPNWEKEGKLKKLVEDLL